MPEKCLIIGLGQIGMSYDFDLSPTKAVYSHAQAFSLHPAFEIVGAVDPSADRRALFESRYGAPAYFDVRSALKAGGVDVVVIATPTTRHNEVLNTILEFANPKAVLCEKPLSLDLSEARKMVEDCDAAQISLFVNYIRRSDIGAMEIKRRIEACEILSPIKGVAWYSKGFLHNGSHFFNLLEYWLGAFVKAQVLNHGRLWNNQDPEPDVQVEFERGIVIFQAAWEEAFSHYTIELLSPSGRLRYEQGGESIAWQSTHSDPNFSGYQILEVKPEMIANSMSRYQWHVADQLAGALAGRPCSLCTGKQALATLEAMDKIINWR
ncbi:MAG: Gfo/Idh/MocA family oxidoreductase [Pseudomonadota bacterium]